MKRIALLILLLLSPIVVFAQEPQFEYGLPEDMKGAIRFYVDTGADFKSREQIVKEIEKKKTNLQLVRTKEEADIILRFRRDEYVRDDGAYAAVYPNSVIAVPIQTEVKRGAGVVYKRLGNNRVLILMSYEGKSEWKKDIAPKFARKFLDAYAKANR